MYKEYHESWYLMILSKRNYEQTKNKYDELLENITKITTSLSQNTSMKTGVKDKLSILLAKKIDLEKIITSQKDLYYYRKSNVDEKLKELNNSKETSDIIYCLKFISKRKVREISETIHFTREYTYELISNIRKEFNKIELKVKEKNKKNAIF